MTLDNNIREAVCKALDRTDKIWSKVKDEFKNERKTVLLSLTEEKIPSLLPDLEFLQTDDQKTPYYVALVLDMRKSTEHLLQAVNLPRSQISRVMTETFAINAMGGVIVEHYKGRITEYTGDGFLAFFKVKDDESDFASVRMNAYHCADRCLEAMAKIVNPELYKRYELPAVNIGIGMAYSKAIVTVVGTKPNLQVKAIGECVFRASKISDGINKIQIDNGLRNGWPVAKNGKGAIRIIERQKDKRFKSFEIAKNTN